MYVYAGLPQSAETQEHEGDTKKKIAYHAVVLPVYQDDCHEEHGIDEVCDVE